MKANQPAIFTKAEGFLPSLLLILGLTLRLHAQDTNINFQAAQAAADKGEAKAQYQVARCYEKGQGVPQDYVKAANTCASPPIRAMPPPKGSLAIFMVWVWASLKTRRKL